MPLKEIEGETFEEYFKTLKDDFYNNLALEGYDKSNMSPTLIKANEIALMATAKRFWEIKISIEKIPDMFEDGIPALKGKGNQ